MLHVPALPGFANVFNALQGGALALLAQQALSTMAVTAAGAGGELAPVDLHVTYMRPAVIGDAPFAVRAHVVRSGGRVIDTACEVHTASGVVAVARASHVRPAR